MALFLFLLFYKSVCELDLVFSLHKSLLILFEMFIGGMLCENNKREVLKAIVEAEELVEEMTKPVKIQQVNWMMDYHSMNNFNWDVHRDDVPDSKQVLVEDKVKTNRGVETLYVSREILILFSLSWHRPMFKIKPLPGCCRTKSTLALF